MTYRSDLDALAARHAALSAMAADAAEQRDTAARMLADARARAKLPILDNIKVASPCTEPWANMPGDERVRACAKCKENVYNLSDMTREEAETLLRERNGKLCVRYFQRSDGTILLADCNVGRKRTRYRRALAVGIAASVAGGIGGVARHVSHSHDKDEIVGKWAEVQEVQGGAVADPAPAPVAPPATTATR
jgi:hypothetical protein